MLQEKLIHSTRDNTARYPEFDRKFKNFPSYIRRAVTAKALGMVSSYVSNYKNWLALSPAERGWMNPSLDCRTGMS